MENEIDRIVGLFDGSSILLKKIPKSRRDYIDVIEVVFLDVVNGRSKHRRAYTFADILEAFEEGAKPIGLLLLNWDDPDKLESQELPDITTDQQQILLSAFAEAQDEIRAQLGEFDDGD